MTLIFSCASTDGIRIMLAMSRHNLCLLLGMTTTEHSGDVPVAHNEMFANSYWEP